MSCVVEEESVDEFDVSERLAQPDGYCIVDEGYGPICVPDMSEDECIAVGGEWVFEDEDEDECEVGGDCQHRCSPAIGGCLDKPFGFECPAEQCCTVYGWCSPDPDHCVPPGG